MNKGIARETIPVVISGLGHLSALGQGVPALREGLAGLRKPRIDSRTVQTAHGLRAVNVYSAPEIELPPDIPESVKRRMSRISKMYFATSLEARRDALARGVVMEPSRTGLVIGTGMGCLESANQYQRRVILEGPAGASPSLFASSIQNAIGSHLSISFGIQGPTSTVSTMDQTTIGALRVAYDWLQQQIVDHVIVTVGDEMSEYQPYALAHLPEPLSTRLDPRSDACTAIAGEGMGSLVLSRADATACDPGYARLSDLRLWTETCPEAARFLVAAYGGAGQWSRYKNWVSLAPPPATPRELLSHAELFGSSPTGSVFEVVIAALLVAQDRRATVCVQMTDPGEIQTICIN